MKYLFFSVLLLILGQLLAPWTAGIGILWLIPLMLRSFDHPWTFAQGFFWGLLVFGFHLGWLFCMFMSRGTGAKGILIWIMILIWFACGSGIWFRLTRYSWIVSTIIFFMYLTQWSLLPCGVLEGYPLMNPLLCLVVIPELLRIVYYVGDFGGWLLIILFSRAMAWFIRSKNWKFFVLSLGCLAPFFCGLIYIKKTAPMDGMVFITPWWYGCKNPMFVGYRIVDGLYQAESNNKDVHTFVMPESTFCFDLQEYQHFVPIWCDDFEGKNIILGAHRKIGKYCRNSIFMLRDGAIVSCYDKQHLMPFVEKKVCLLDFLGVMQLFPVQADQCLSNDFQDDIIMINQTSFQLFLCSELFFQAKATKQFPVLLLWNDSWLYFAWTKKIAMLFIDYFAIKNDVAIVHASTQGRTNIV